jgi:hypothetical protein
MALSVLPERVPRLRVVGDDLAMQSRRGPRPLVMKNSARQPARDEFSHRSARKQNSRSARPARIALGGSNAQSPGGLPYAPWLVFRLRRRLLSRPL